MDGPSQCLDAPGPGTVTKPRIIRLTELTPEAVRELEERYADLLARYINLGHNHVDLMQKYHELLERHLCKTTLVP
jgi:hypothetical protein